MQDPLDPDDQETLAFDTHFHRHGITSLTNLVGPSCTGTCWFPRETAVPQKPEIPRGGWRWGCGLTGRRPASRCARAPHALAAMLRQTRASCPDPRRIRLDRQRTRMRATG